MIVRENILFGLPYGHQKCQKVIYSWALTSDLETFSIKPIGFSLSAIFIEMFASFVIPQSHFAGYTQPRDHCIQAYYTCDHSQWCRHFSGIISNWEPWLGEPIRHDTLISLIRYQESRIESYERSASWYRNGVTTEIPAQQDTWYSWNQ